MRAWWALLAVIQSSAASAQEFSPAEEDCYRGHWYSLPPQQIIRQCTAVIISSEPEGETSGLAYENRDQAHSALRNYDEAIEDFSKSIEIQESSDIEYYFELSNLAGVYVLRAEAQHNLGNYRGAIDDYTIASRIDPDGHWEYWRRALSYYRLEEYERALEDVDREIEESSYRHEPYVVRSNINCALGDYNNALEDLLEAVRLGFDPLGYKVQMQSMGYYDGSIDPGLSLSMQDSLRSWMQDGCPRY